MACIILLGLATFTLARPAQENQPMPIRFCGRDLIRTIDEVCVAIKSPAAFIDPVALNQSSSLADSESGLLFSPEAKSSILLITLIFVYSRHSVEKVDGIGRQEKRFAFASVLRDWLHGQRLDYFLPDRQESNVSVFWGNSVTVANSLQ
jgi:hypothetical protein